MLVCIIHYSLSNRMLSHLYRDGKVVYVWLGHKSETYKVGFQLEEYKSDR